MSADIAGKSVLQANFTHSAAMEDGIGFMIEARGLKRLEIGPVDLTVLDGECISIMGRSGSGKSVLLRMFADLDPHEGDALLDDVPCSSMAASTWRSMVTYVPAESGWWAERAADNFSATCFPRSVYRRRRWHGQSRGSPPLSTPILVVAVALAMTTAASFEIHSRQVRRLRGAWGFTLGAGSTGLATFVVTSLALATLRPRRGTPPRW